MTRLPRRIRPKKVRKAEPLRRDGLPKHWADRWLPCESRYEPAGLMREFVADDGSFGIEQVTVMCGNCRTCKARNRHNVVGRISAEALDTPRTYFVTLTIGGDTYYKGRTSNVRANNFHPKDVSDYLKRLRLYTVRDARQLYLEAGGEPAGFEAPRIRFMRVGEYGTLKGRVHYHLVLFFYGGDAPEGIPFERNFFHGKQDESVGALDVRLPQLTTINDRTYWPWGFSNWAHFNARHAAYVAKYVTKPAPRPEGEESGLEVMRSTRSVRPMLGAKFFADLGEGAANQGLAIRDRKFVLPGYGDQHERVFMLSKSAVLLVGRAYFARWYQLAKTDPGRPPHPPHTDFVEAFNKWEGKRLAALPDHAAKAEALRNLRARYREAVKDRGGEPARPSDNVARASQSTPARPRVLLAAERRDGMRKLLGEAHAAGDAEALALGVELLQRAERELRAERLAAFETAHEGEFPSWADVVRSMRGWGVSDAEILARVTLTDKERRRGGKLATPEFWLRQDYPQRPFHVRASHAAAERIRQAARGEPATARPEWDSDHRVIVTPRDKRRREAEGDDYRKASRSGGGATAVFDGKNGRR